MINILRNSFIQNNTIKINNTRQNSIAFKGILEKKAITVLNSKSGQLEKAVLKLEKDGNMHYAEILKEDKCIGSIDFSVLRKSVDIEDIESKFNKIYKKLEVDLVQIAVESALAKKIEKIATKVNEVMEPLMLFSKQIGMIIDESLYSIKKTDSLEKEISRCFKKKDFSDFRFKWDLVDMKLSKKALREFWIPRIKENPILFSKEQAEKLGDKVI